MTLAPAICHWRAPGGVRKVGQTHIVWNLLLIRKGPWFHDVFWDGKDCGAIGSHAGSLLPVFGWIEVGWSSSLLKLMSKAHERHKKKRTSCYHAKYHKKPMWTPICSKRLVEVLTLFCPMQRPQRIVGTLQSQLQIATKLRMGTNRQHVHAMERLDPTLKHKADSINIFINWDSSLFGSLFPFPTFLLFVLYISGFKLRQKNMFECIGPGKCFHQF